MAQLHQADPMRPDLPPNARIACDWECVKCGYNLRTLRVDGVCTECGAAVVPSLTLPPDASAIRAINLVILSWFIALASLLINVLHAVSWLVFFIGVRQLAVRSQMIRSIVGESCRRGMLGCAQLGLIGSIIVVAVALIEERGRIAPLIPRPAQGPGYSIGSMAEWRNGARIDWFGASYSDIPGNVWATRGTHGKTTIVLKDGTDAIVSRVVLSPGGQANAKDADGNGIEISLGDAGNVTIVARTDAVMTFSSAGMSNLRRSLTIHTVFSVIFTTGVLFVLVGQGASICYLIVARKIAGQIGRRGLAKLFRVVLWAFVAGIPAIAIISMRERWLAAWTLLPATMIRPWAVQLLSGTVDDILSTVYFFAACFIGLGSASLRLALRDTARRPLVVDIDPNEA